MLHGEMRSLLVVSLVFVCFMDQSDGTFADFMNNLPKEISKAFSTAWGSMQDAIKEPVKIKRIGKGGSGSTNTTGKLKTTTTVRSVETGRPREDPDQRYYSSIEINIPHQNPSLSKSSTLSGRRLRIPHLQVPPRIMTIGNRRYILHDYDQ